MRIAVIERFSEPSRTCDVNRLAVGDEVDVVRLRGGAPTLPCDAAARSHESKVRHAWREAIGFAPLAGRCLRSLAGILTDSGLSARDKRGLIASALATRGAPLAALAGARDAVRLLGRSSSIASTASDHADLRLCRF